jgi:hypothetical protein
MVFTDNKVPVREINTYEELEVLIAKKSKGSYPFKNYDKVKMFFDDILSRESIGIKQFTKEWRAFYSKIYPNSGDRNVNYYLLRGYDESEAIGFIKKLQTRIAHTTHTPEVIAKRVATWKKNPSKIKSQRGREFYRLKGLSEEEIDIKLRKRNDKWMQSLEDYVERTGDNFHERKGWNYEYMRDKHGHEKATEIMNARGTPHDNFIKLHGEDWKTHYVNTRFSRKNLTEKYGEDVADEMIYQTCRKRVLNTRKHKKGLSSKIELDYFTTLNDTWKRQMVFKGGNGVVYIFDFYNEEANKLIEFQGDYWHCNPEKYKSDYFHTVKQMYAWEIWEFDAQKKRQAEEQGWEVEYVWESDYLKTRIQSDHAVN